jgi:hypothetical protein
LRVRPKAADVRGDCEKEFGEIYHCKRSADLACGHDPRPAPLHMTLRSASAPPKHTRGHNKVQTINTCARLRNTAHNNKTPPHSSPLLGHFPRPAHTVPFAVYNPSNSIVNNQTGPGSRAGRLSLAVSSLHSIQGMLANFHSMSHSCCCCRNSVDRTVQSALTPGSSTRVESSDRTHIPKHQAGNQLREPLLLPNFPS